MELSREHRRGGVAARSSPDTASAGLDADSVRALERHEMDAQAGARRAVRDLGDALLLSDPLDADPMLNRAGALRFPSSPRAFDARLDELIVLFATIGRVPHVRTSPLHDVPGDLSRRLRDGGFALAGETQIMVLAGRLPTDARLPDGLGVRRAAGITGPAARRVASEAAAVLGAAFHVAATDILAAELAASLGDPRVTLYLVASEAGPLAVAKRFTAGHLSYISSVGTLPAWRGRGLATAATAAATADAMDAGSRRVHLSVHGPDPGATRLYSRLGYVRVGAPAEHYLAT